MLCFAFTLLRVDRYRIAAEQLNKHSKERTITLYTIKDLRAKTGMTQKAFAEYFRIPKRTVEDWEYEKRKCPDYLVDLIHYKLLKEGLIKD